MKLTPAFRLALPHGTCVGVRIPETVDGDGADLDAFAHEERQALDRLAPARRPSWAAGRAALRAALADAGFEAGALLTNARGAPVIPRGAAGSISHKNDLAVALAARSDDAHHLGVDIELDGPARIDISARVLTSEEAAALAGLPEESRRREVLLRFCAKEAIYKALDPFLARTLSFKEAAIAAFQADGIAPATLMLARGEGPFDIDVRWTTVAWNAGATFFLTTAQIRSTWGP